MAWLEVHTERLPLVCIESDPYKEAGEDIKHPLQPLRLGRRNKAIVGIEICRQVPYRQAKYLHAILGWRHHRHPVVDDGVHDHTEERDGQGFALGHAAVPFEQNPKVSAGRGHHGQAVPVCPKDSGCPGADPVRHKNIKAYVLIQGITCLLEVSLDLREAVPVPWPARNPCSTS